MSAKGEKAHKDGGMPAWLIFLWVGFLIWIVGYIVINLLGPTPWTPAR